MKPDQVAEFFHRLAKAQPAPKTELQYATPYTLLVAVVLSAQATDAGVNRATPALFAAADSPAKMVALGEARVRELIKTIGLFRTKAKNIVALSKLLIERHGGKVPDNRDALEALPGVGRKTANVVLNVAYGEPTIAVDTHIFRVVQPHRPGARQNTPRGGTQTRKNCAEAIFAARAPLADSARALYLRGAQATLSGLRGARSVRLQGQNPERLGLTRDQPAPARKRSFKTSPPSPQLSSLARAGSRLRASAWTTRRSSPLP